MTLQQAQEQATSFMNDNRLMGLPTKDNPLTKSVPYQENIHLALVALILRLDAEAKQEAFTQYQQLEKIKNAQQ